LPEERKNKPGESFPRLIFSFLLPIFSFALSEKSFRWQGGRKFRVVSRLLFEAQTRF